MTLYTSLFAVDRPYGVGHHAKIINIKLTTVLRIFKSRFFISVSQEGNVDNRYENGTLIALSLFQEAWFVQSPSLDAIHYSCSSGSRHTPPHHHICPHPGSRRLQIQITVSLCPSLPVRSPLIHVHNKSTDL